MWIMQLTFKLVLNHKYIKYLIFQIKIFCCCVMMNQRNCTMYCGNKSVIHKLESKFVKFGLCISNIRIFPQQIFFNQSKGFNFQRYELTFYPNSYYFVYCSSAIWLGGSIHFGGGEVLHQVSTLMG